MNLWSHKFDFYYYSTYFSIFSVAGFVGSQIWGKYMAVYGAKIFIYGGLILFVSCHF